MTYAERDKVLFINEGLCSDCADEEFRCGNDCMAREDEARSRGERYECTCPKVVCTHREASEEDARECKHQRLGHAPGIGQYCLDCDAGDDLGCRAAGYVSERPEPKIATSADSVALPNSCEATVRSVDVDERQVRIEVSGDMGPWVRRLDGSAFTITVVQKGVAK